MLTYNISQWSRNFTFGMFYFFASNLVSNYSSNNNPLAFQTHFMLMLGWLVLSLLVIEWLLFIQLLGEEL